MRAFLIYLLAFFIGAMIGGIAALFNMSSINPKGSIFEYGILALIVLRLCDSTDLEERSPVASNPECHPLASSTTSKRDFIFLPLASFSLTIPPIKRIKRIEDDS